MGVFVPCTLTEALSCELMRRPFAHTWPLFSGKQPLLVPAPDLHHTWPLLSNNTHLPSSLLRPVLCQDPPTQITAAPCLCLPHWSPAHTSITAGPPALSTSTTRTP